MQPARPLRDVFDELARGTSPAGALADSGHQDLPDRLVSEAIVNYADTAPIEVAEHLAPFVKVHSAVPAEDSDGTDAAGLAADRGLDLLATAPDQVVSDDAGEPEPPLDYAGPADGDLSYGGDPEALDFAFGSGADEQTGEGVPHIEEPEQDHGVVFEPYGDMIAPAPPVPETSDETVGWSSPIEPVAPAEGDDDDEDPDIVRPGEGG
jgi:hypothetical protein